MIELRFNSLTVVNLNMFMPATLIHVRFERTTEKVTNLSLESDITAGGFYEGFEVSL